MPPGSWPRSEGTRKLSQYCKELCHCYMNTHKHSPSNGQASRHRGSLPSSQATTERQSNHRVLGRLAWWPLARPLSKSARRDETIARLQIGPRTFAVHDTFQSAFACPYKYNQYKNNCLNFYRVKIYLYHIFPFGQLQNHYINLKPTLHFYPQA